VYLFEPQHFPQLSSRKYITLLLFQVGYFMAGFNIRAIISVTAAILLIAFHPTNAAITCNQVTSDIEPCLPYARTGRGNPSNRCCTGVSSLNSAATTQADRQTACNCLKNIIQEGNLDATAVASIPSKCGVDVPYPISTSTDCSQYVKPTPT
jgi:Protease inhibitor/seed storage/LTP family